MAGDVLISYLPNEILEQILESRCLSYRDVCNFGSTCNKFRNLVCNSNKLWKSKFQQQWPKLQDVYDSERTFMWQQEFVRRFNCGWVVRRFISEMSSKFYRKDELSNCDLAIIDSIMQDHMQDHEYAYYFVISELMSIAHDGDPEGNLTEKFYTEKVIRYVRQNHLAKKWHYFLRLPPEKLILEKGAVFVAQWSQPLIEVKYKNIAKQLDDIASEVKVELKRKHSNHPLFRAPMEKFTEWKNENICDNQWSSSESQQILNALRSVLFEQMGFHGNNEMYYNVENSFLNKVLELRCGIPITLSIVYESIARRLGVKCEPVNFPAHFLLRWQEKYKTDGERSPYYYIDVYNGGQFLTKRDCPHYSPNSQCPMREMKMQPASFVQVVERLANNLELAGRQRAQGREARLRSTLELLHLVNPSDMNCVFHLARFYMLHNMNLGDLVSALKETQDNLGPREREQATHIIKMMRVYESHHNKEAESLPDIEPKLRASGVEYAVGMIMRHLRYDYICVIYGWDPLCNASQEWIYQMGVDNLPCKDRQPFYNVLVDDGSTRYVAQENLEVALNPIKIKHVDVGRFFKKFCETHYIPNTEKEEEYPQDTEVRLQFLSLSGIEVQKELREL